MGKVIEVPIELTVSVFSGGSCVRRKKWKRNRLGPTFQKGHGAAKCKLRRKKTIFILKNPRLYVLKSNIFNHWNNGNISGLMEYRLKKKESQRPHGGVVEINLRKKLRGRGTLKAATWERNFICMQFSFYSRFSVIERKILLTTEER